MRHSTALAAFLLAATTAHAMPAYTLSRTVTLGAPDRWDYLSFDAKSNRVFVAHTDHTDVVDASSGKILGRLGGLHGAHGQAVAADGTIWADSGKTAQITAYNPDTFAAIKTLPAGTDADGVLADPEGAMIVVLDGDGQSATLLDAKSKTVKLTIPLKGEPEFGASDAPGHFCVNSASTNEILAVDATAGRVTARFAVPQCERPHGLALDAQARRLFASCVNAKLVVLDAGSGHVLQTLPIGHGTDAAVFDPDRKLVFSANGEGTLSMFRENAAGILVPLGDMKTSPGARTMALDPATGRIFLVTADVTGAAPTAGPRWAFKPGTVKLLFLDPVSR